MKYYTYKKQVPLQPGDRIGYKRGKGYYLIPAPVPIPPKPQPSPSVFAGKGLFTTSEPGVCSGRPANWVALQLDPEGNERPPNTNARICWWMARPTLEVVTRANQHGIPFIGQAENQEQLDACLSLGPKLLVPKALVGNPTSWSSGYGKAVSQGWELIVEWYMNAHPWEKLPDAGNYPLFVNACCGIYSEGEPGGQGYVKQIPLADYRAVWHGSFSVWKAEAMTEADWAVFAA